MRECYTSRVMESHRIEFCPKIEKLKSLSSMTAGIRVELLKKYNSIRGTFSVLWCYSGVKLFETEISNHYS